MNETVKDMHDKAVKKYKTEKNAFKNFPIDARVKIITPCCDFTFFYGETGRVVEKYPRYLGIKVEFDDPRHYEDGKVMTYFNFNPQDLYLLSDITGRFEFMNEI